MRMTSLGKWAPLKLIVIVSPPHASPLVIEGDHTANDLNGKLATKPVAAQQDIQRQALVLALEQARYDAQRARRQYDLADPENRLVAGELEHRWNEALQRVQDAETHRAALAQGPGPLREEQRQQLLSLSQALSAVWRHTAAPEALKKRLLRTVLSEIMIDSTPEPAEYLLRLHWHGGVHTE